MRRQMEPEGSKLHGRERIGFWIFNTLESGMSLSFCPQ